MENTESITVETMVDAELEKVWECWTIPEHIMKWNNASPDWHTTYAENDLRKDGSFKFTMASKDESFSFDFEGIYTDIISRKFISYKLADNRKVIIKFNQEGNSVKVTETFDPETQNPVEMQRAGWQAIIDNFKKYTESLS